MAEELSSIESLTPSPDGWHDERQVDNYLRRTDRLGPRATGEELLAELLPDHPLTLLDLGAGDGRLAALGLTHRPMIREAVLLDNSEPMLQRARDRFESDARVRVLRHDLRQGLPELGRFDLIVSGASLHHLEDSRKRSLFAEVFAMLEHGGLFANLDVIASATPALHAAFLAAIGREADDPEDRLTPIEAQLQWMREAGLTNVDAQWRWRGLALMIGTRPEA